MNPNSMNNMAKKLLFPLAVMLLHGMGFTLFNTLKRQNVTVAFRHNQYLSDANARQ
jgi:hypothetical protein